MDANTQAHTHAHTRARGSSSERLRVRAALGRAPSEPSSEPPSRSLSSACVRSGVRSRCTGDRICSRLARRKPGKERWRGEGECDGEWGYMVSAPGLGPAPSATEERGDFLCNATVEGSGDSGERRLGWSLAPLE